MIAEDPANDYKLATKITWVPTTSINSVQLTLPARKDIFVISTSCPDPAFKSPPPLSLQNYTKTRNYQEEKKKKAPPLTASLPA
jgi:hypothetical protein